jgi:hypothetical protein
MNCQKIQEAYWDYHAQRLPARLTAGIDSHLKACPACSSHYETFKAVDGELEQLGDIEPSAYFDQKLNARLDALIEGKSNRPAWRFWLRPQYVAGFAVLLIALGSVWIWVHHQWNTNPTTSNLAKVQPPEAKPSLGHSQNHDIAPSGQKEAATVRHEPSNENSADDELIPQEDMAVVENMDLLKNYDLIKNIDFSQEHSGKPAQVDSN